MVSVSSTEKPRDQDGGHPLKPVGNGQTTRKRKATSGCTPQSRPSKISRRKRCSAVPERVQNLAEHQDSADLIQREIRPKKLVFDTTLDPLPGDLSSNRYTFGLELELIIVCSLDELIARIPAQLKEKPREELHRALQAATEEGGLDHIVRILVQEVLESAKLDVNDARAEEESIQKWAVDVEPAIEPSVERKAYPHSVVNGIEIRTGALEYSAASLAEVVRGIEAIKAKFITVCNESCGLHVHVGKADRATGKQEKIDLQTCQSLLVLELLFEKEVALLHPHHVLHGHEWPQWPSVRFATIHDMSRLAAATHISRLHSLSSLLNLLFLGRQEDRNLTINFQNLAGKRTYGTIEFRQHEGTMNLEAILRRIQLCVAFSHWASTSGSDIERLLWASSQGFRLDTIGLLKYVGVPRETINYYQSQLRQQNRTSSPHSALPTVSEEVGDHEQASKKHRVDLPASDANADSRRSSRYRGDLQRPFAVQGSRLVLPAKAHYYEIQYRIVGNGTEPVWENEGEVIWLKGLSKKDFVVSKTTRERRWPGTKREVVQRRWCS